MSSSYRCTRDYWFRFRCFVFGCLCVLLSWGQFVCLFCVFGVFSPVCFVLSVSVQVIA